MKKFRTLFAASFLATMLVSSALAFDGMPAPEDWFVRLYRSVVTAFTGDGTGDCGFIKICIGCKPNNPDCRPA